MSSARTSEPHHRAGLVERHPGVLHQRAGRPRQGRHVGGAAAPQVELEAGFVQGFPELRLHQLRNRRHGQRVPTRFVQKYTVRARLDPARGSAGFRSSLSSSREDDQGANTAAPPRRPRGRRRRPLPPPRRRCGRRRPRDSRLSCAPPCRVTTSATGRQSYRRANQSQSAQRCTAAVERDRPPKLVSRPLSVLALRGAAGHEQPVELPPRSTSITPPPPRPPASPRHSAPRPLGLRRLSRTARTMRNASTST